MKAWAERSVFGKQVRGQDRARDHYCYCCRIGRTFATRIEFLAHTFLIIIDHHLIRASHLRPDQIQEFVDNKHFRSVDPKGLDCGFRDFRCIWLVSATVSTVSSLAIFWEFITVDEISK